MSTPYRTCPQCGTPQTPGQTFCSNCGAHFTNISNSGVPPTELATPANQVPYGQSPDPYNTPQYNNTNYGNQPYAPPPPSFPGYNPAGQPGGNAYGQQPQGGYYPPFPRAPQPQKRSNAGWIIGGILLVLVLIGGGIFAYSAANSHKDITQTTPTTTNATATTLPTATALFSDNFANNSKNWNTQSASGYGITINNNALTMKEANHRIFQEPVPTNVPNDFAVSTTFTFVQGDLNDSAGLQLRSNNNGAQGYVVEVYGDDAYDIIKISPDPKDNTKLKFTTIVSPSHSDAIHAKGQQNIMNLVMKGSTLLVQFNGQTVKTITDSTFSSGSMSLFLSNGDTSKGAIATFNTISIYQAPSQLS